MTEKRKIFCLNNGGSPGWMSAQALSEDGYFLAGHICSSEGFMPHDLGMTSNWKHENYNAHFGEGNWELVWVPTEEVQARSHAGMEAAYAKHLTLTEEDFARVNAKIEAAKANREKPSPPPEPTIRWTPLHRETLAVAVIDQGAQWAAYVVPVPGIHHETEAAVYWRGQGEKLPEENARTFFPDLADIQYRP